MRLWYDSNSNAKLEADISKKWVFWLHWKKSFDDFTFYDQQQQEKWLPSNIKEREKLLKTRRQKQKESKIKSADKFTLLESSTFAKNIDKVSVIVVIIKIDKFCCKQENMSMRIFFVDWLRPEKRSTPKQNCFIRS